MDAGTFCSRKRPCGGADLRLHQEAQLHKEARLHQEARLHAGCRRSSMEQEVKRRRRDRGGKENRDPGEDLLRTRTTQRKDQRRLSQTRTRTAACPEVRSGLRSEVKVQVQVCRQEIKTAQIRKTRSQNPVQNRGSGALITTDQADPGSTEIETRTTCEVRSRSTMNPSTEASRASDGVLCPEPCTRESGQQRTTNGSGVRTRIRRRRKIQPSAFRGRGQLWLSINVEAGQLIIHIHEARGLMGKSRRSCDSYVKLTSDLDHSIRMKTRTVPDKKNPEYEQNFTLCITERLLPSRLLVSVFRRLPDTRCSQLIGCMSFGIGSLVSSPQLLTGWFYLLAEEYGRSKHLRVTSRRSRPTKSLLEEPEQKEAELEADLRKTPDSAPETEQNCTNSTGTIITNQSNCPPSTLTRPKDSIQHGVASGRPLSLDSANANVSGYVSAPFGSTQQLPIAIIRGKDGFGFTICSDCPVRVQAVDPGGPAHQSGLRQGDSVLQLNGFPVETWKCADLAHAIRSCPSQIGLVVWRGLPEVSSGCETLLRPPAHNTTTGSKLLSHPSHSKHGRRRGQGFGVRSSLGALGSLWRDRKEEQREEEEEEEEEDQEVFSPNTTTLKGTRVTSSNGDNYIILSPVNPGGQLLHPVYQDRNGTIGRLYQTHPCRGQNLLHNPRPGKSQRPPTSHTSTLPPHCPKTAASTPHGNHGNYQNCTIVQSHLPHSGYGNYVTLAPKTLIFPIFVQPLDLCSPDRTLLMSEEMILHQADMLPAKVTVLIYSDLLLFTREDEAGRCNVLQSPLYLNTIQLREVPSEPLHIYFLQSSHSCWRCLFSLEAFSIEQKVQVSLCLHDNIQLQLVSTETGRSQQLSDLPSDFGLLSLGQSDLLYHPSSPYASLCDLQRPASPSPYSCGALLSASTTPPPPPLSSASVYISSPSSRTVTSPPPYVCPPRSSASSTLRSPIWKERGETEEEGRTKRRREEEVEERQQGEGESASETSESVGGVFGHGLLISPHRFSLKDEYDEEEESNEEEGGSDEEFASKPAVLRRSLSEGSLLQEPRSPRFLSDSTIHRLTRTATFDLSLASSPAPSPPSPQTLRKHLTKEGVSLHHMLLLLNGIKGVESSNHQLKKKKTKSLVADVRSRLAFLRRRKNCTGIHGNSLEKALRNNRPSVGEVLRWAESLEALLTNQYGLAVFRHFLRSEFSEENLDFWLAVERFKSTRPFSKMATRAEKIYNEFISSNAVRQVNVDSFVRDSTGQSLRFGVTPACFQLAQDQIFTLMETDSYPRFLRSRLYAQLANPNVEMASEPPNQRRAISQS
ncbi:regulator of G-protein signaling 3 isoform X2 [Kryptolebias marmoratus]|uniref:regulator of G-protein signaling 3 isoform X2 n=1 Tax=Kryptolebias marmoratus TaxID=37003 RepID=UPI0007F924BA|nr:regulator of G-protein signaling 3 isoform X2 [Kryptolebias marmoratus]